VEKIRPNAVPFFYFYSSLFWKPSFSQIDYILQKLIPKLSFNADHAFGHVSRADELDTKGPRYLIKRRPLYLGVSKLTQRQP